MTAASLSLTAAPATPFPQAPATKFFVEYEGKRQPVEAGMTLDEVKAQMAKYFSELENPTVETQTEGDGEDKLTIWVFSKNAAQKGASSPSHG